MNKVLDIFIFVFVSVFLFGGCAQLKQYLPGSETFLQQDDSNYLLSCLKEFEEISTDEFASAYKRAEKMRHTGSDHDTLHFICLSLNAKADYKQFKHGAHLLAQYISEHPDASDRIVGVKILVDQLDNRRNLTESLVEDKKELNSEIKNLNKKLEQEEKLAEELQQQIEQLKNIENIIENREIGQP